MKKTSIALLVAALTTQLAACSSDSGSDSNSGSNSIVPDPIPYPVVDNDDTAEFDLSQDYYACYTMETSLGDIKLAIDTQHAPTTATNFDTYVSAGFYDGLVFHRVIKNFVIQAGGFAPGLEQKETLDPIEIESFNGLKNYRGRLAMARTSVPDSATSQFYINHVDNHSLNATSTSYGYTVFGMVYEGLDVVDAIAEVDTG